MLSTFRGRLLAAFLITSLLATGLGLLVMYRLAYASKFESYQAKVLSVAASVAAAIDGERHMQLLTEGESGENYRRLKDQLRRATIANRREDTWVEHIFTTYPSPENAGVALIGVNPEDSALGRTKLGEVYRGERAERLARMGPPGVDEHLTKDQFGEFLAASAPITDNSGKTVAMLTVQFTAARVALRMRPMIWAGAISLGLAVALAVAGSLYFARRVSRPLDALREAIGEIARGNFDARVDETGKDEFGVVGRSVNAMAAGLKEREAVKGAFARYVSRQVMDSVLQSGAPPSVRGDRRKITVLFCDIRGFSTLAENMRPEEVVELLNEYFEKMVDIVFRHKGTLDKFLGDGMMAIFGAPEDDPYQEEHAIQAALEMQKALGGLRRGHLAIGIGINSGPAIVGNIGSSQRMEYTAIGDTVNLAARLETATKELGASIVISEYTYNAVRGQFPARDLGRTRVKGRNDGVQVYGIGASA